MVGSEVVRQLLERREKVLVLTRDAAKAASLPHGVAAAVGDLERPATVGPAFEGADGVFLLNALSPNETAQGLAGVAAAKAAKVRRLVYLSVHHAEDTPEIPHFASKLPVEKAIRESGIPYTILRPNNFYQNDLWLRDAIMQYGVYPQPMGEGGLNRVDVRDIAETAVLGLTEPGHEGKTYSLVGPETLTASQTAAIWARQLGRDVLYAGDDLDAWEAQAVKMMPAWMVKDLRIMYAHFQFSGLKATSAEIEALTKALGHAPRKFADFVAETAAHWKSAAQASRQ